MSATIYELRAYMGQTRVFFTRIFADMESATKYVDNLMSYPEEFRPQQGSMICPLTLRDGAFEPWLEERIYFI